MDLIFFFLVDQIDLVSQRHIVFDLNVSLFVCKKNMKIDKGTSILFHRRNSKIKKRCYARKRIIRLVLVYEKNINNQFSLLQIYLLILFFQETLLSIVLIVRIVVC